jgi:hypothetical protein
LGQGPGGWRRVLARGQRSLERTEGLEDSDHESDEEGGE